MRDILEQFNREAGVAGSMVLSPDGMLIAEALGARTEPESLAAFSASLLVTVGRKLGKLGVTGSPESCTITGTAGRITLFDMENSYLVAVTEPDRILAPGSDAVRNAVNKIKNRRVD